MKGQIFLVIAVLVILVLILTKTETSFLKTVEQQRFQLYSMLPENYENLKNEYERTVHISLSKNKSMETMVSNLNNFSNFSSTAFERKNYTFQVFYSFAFVNSSTLNITVGNFLGKTIKNITINQSLATGTLVPLGTLANRNSGSRGLEFSSQSQFNVTVKYFINETAYNFTYSTDTNKTVGAYFDIFLQEHESYMNDKLILNITSY